MTKVHIGEDTSHELGVGSILFVADIPLRITRLPYVIIGGTSKVQKSVSLHIGSSSHYM